MTKLMETYKPFSVVVVPFPFTDQNHTKRRPAVVLSRVKHQEQTGHVTVVMITSAKNSHWPSDYEIKQLSVTGLQASSMVRQKIFTLDNRLIMSQIGQLAAIDKKALGRMLEEHLMIL